jgi:lysophospholipase L1-like esterase
MSLIRSRVPTPRRVALARTGTPLEPLERTSAALGGSPPRAAIPAMVEANRAAAAAVGCGFWDAYAWMGGAGSSRQWRKAGWLTNDFTHPSPSGNARIGAALAAGLLEGYAAFRGR